MGETKVGTGFHKGTTFTKNKDGTVDVVFKDGNKTTYSKRDWNQAKMQTVHRTVNEETGKVEELFDDSKAFRWLERNTTRGQMARKGEPLQPTLAKKVKKKGGKIKTYAKGSIVRKPRSY